VDFTDDVVAMVAVTMDGYIARADGAVDFLDKYAIEEFDFDDFMEGIGAIVTGSATYEQAVGFGWAYGARPTLVLTGRSGLPVPDDADVQFSDSPTPLAVREFAAATPGRLWLLGGGRVITDALLGGAVDTLDLTVIPEALGSGIPLFCKPFDAPLELVETTPYAGGAVRLIYRVG
jgi:dihydrofolate reductase